MAWVVMDRFTAPDGSRVQYRKTIGKAARDPRLFVSDDLVRESPLADWRGQYLSVQQARERAVYLKTVAGQRDPRQVEAEQAAAREAEEAEAQAVAAATTKRLLDTYVAHLKRTASAKTARDVEYAFRKYLAESAACGALMVRAARSVTAKEWAAALAPLHEAGKARTAGMLRSYLRAAYGLAVAAELDATVPTDFRAFKIEANPIAAIPAKGAGISAGQHTLNLSELRAYVGRLRAMPSDATRDALLLAALLAGQREEQVCRAMVKDYDAKGGTLTLWDPKGRRTQPRRHVLPLVGEAAEVVAMAAARAKKLRSPHLFARLDASGEALAAPDSLAAAVIQRRKRLVAGMVKATESRPFTARDLRRTAETELVALGISKDLCAQLLSHGLGDVQSRHYDRHTYLAEKTKALEVWQSHLSMDRA
ncbi:hypothetical protein [Niveibacterium sp.]|uniref:hypothetical protein n=1 Tax=Niveibacterium sp. TaxID=2017444 RepID=UPI0035AEB499